jgi:hypothetical protein
MGVFLFCDIGRFSGFATPDAFPLRGIGRYLGFAASRVISGDV